MTICNSNENSNTFLSFLCCNALEQLCTNFIENDVARSALIDTKGRFLSVRRQGKVISEKTRLLALILYLTSKNRCSHKMRSRRYIKWPLGKENMVCVWIKTKYIVFRSIFTQLCDAKSELKLTLSILINVTWRKLYCNVIQAF